MPFSVRLSDEEQALLEAAARRTARSKSELVRQGVRELCQRLARPKRTPLDLGKNLFGAGSLAKAPTASFQRALWDKLSAKHRRLG